MTDEQFEQPQYDPSIEPKSSRAWLNLIADAEKTFAEWQDKCDSIDKQFANLSRLAGNSRDREFQMFWANIQVLGPSIYSRPPVPVVVPRFRNRDAIPRTASEVLERATIVSFEMEDIDQTMKLIRDDLTRLARGCAWVRYEAKERKGKNTDRVCIEHVSRRDWLCSPARKWQEVEWVARRAWMTAEEMGKRFKGNAWKEAAFETTTGSKRKGRLERDPIKKAGVWEIWHKGENKVVWVTEGVDTLLDSGEPHLELEGFFPCPRPAFATVEPDTLKPVPDYVYYKDQIEEINQLTKRIAALSDALKLKGFYPGGGEIGDAVEAVMKRNDDRQIMVPIANWAAFGGSGEQIVWLPIDMVAETIRGLVELRRQLIDDVYQITGLSDIMRGSTDPRETKGAQELKSQYGSIRVRDRQDELVRIARDLTRISAEIIAENFDQKTIEDMTQMGLPTDAEIKKQVKGLEDQAKQIAAQVKKQVAAAKADPQTMAMAQENPEQAQKLLQETEQQAQQQIGGLQQQAQKISEKVTIDQVMKLLKEQRLRPFTMDIETDSTIAPDENAQKQRATEFMTSVGGYMSQAFPLVQQMPEAAPVVADFLKYITSQFRAGREMDTTIDEFAETLKQVAGQPKGNPEADAAQAAAQAEQQRAQAEMQAKAADTQIKQQAAVQDQQIRQADADHAKTMRERETSERITLMQAEEQRKAIEHQQRLDIGTLDIEKRKLELQKLGGQIIADQQTAAIKADQAAQQSAITAQDAERRSSQEEAAFERETVAAENAERRAEMEAMTE
ncbi:MAG: hypothetical protein DI604_30250 [Delftia acidovorans]|nr:MAG: hypothetical protein DI604_30250 [Delftia acidovorans]